MSKPNVINKLQSAGSAHTKDSIGATPIDKSQKRNIYVAALFLISMLILLGGLIIVYSAVQNDDNYSYTKQLIGAVVGIVLMLVF